MYVYGTVRDNKGERTDAIPYKQNAHDAEKVEKGQYRYKKNSRKKKEKGQIPIPTDRALNDADKVKTGLYRDKKHKCINVLSIQSLH